VRTERKIITVVLGGIDNCCEDRKGVRTGGRDYYCKINARINIPLVP
jgi:hypothetical protein